MNLSPAAHLTVYGFPDPKALVEMIKNKVDPQNRDQKDKGYRCDFWGL